MAKTKKYYVVWKGRNPGVFNSWLLCRPQIEGFAGALYKSFPSREEAEAAYQKGLAGFQANPKSKSTSSASSGKKILESISVDAACSGNPGILEYRGVYTKTGKELFHQGPFPHGTQNIGEFLAIVHGLGFLKKHESNWPIYSDSMTAMAWVKRKQIKTTLQQNAKNAPLFDLVDRAIHWLKTQEYSNTILKWPTQEWGEIPADFGRK